MTLSEIDHKKTQLPCRLLFLTVKGIIWRERPLYIFVLWLASWGAGGNNSLPDAGRSGREERSDRRRRVREKWMATNWLPWIHAASAISSADSCCPHGRRTNHSWICDRVVIRGRKKLDKEELATPKYSIYPATKCWLLNRLAATCTEKQVSRSRRHGWLFGNGKKRKNGHLRDFRRGMCKRYVQKRC